MAGNIKSVLNKTKQKKWFIDLHTSRDTAQKFFIVTLLTFIKIRAGRKTLVILNVINFNKTCITFDKLSKNEEKILICLKCY